MKLFNNIAKRNYQSGRIVLLLAGMLLLSACASIHHEKLIPPPLQTDSPAVQVDDVDVLAVSPAMEEFLELFDVALCGLFKTGDLLIAEEQAEHATNTVDGHINTGCLGCSMDPVGQVFDFFSQYIIKTGC